MQPYIIKNRSTSQSPEQIHFDNLYAKLQYDFSQSQRENSILKIQFIDCQRDNADYRNLNGKLEKDLLAFKEEYAKLADIQEKYEKLKKMYIECDQEKARLIKKNEDYDQMKLSARLRKINEDYTQMKKEFLESQSTVKALSEAYNIAMNEVENYKIDNLNIEKELDDCKSEKLKLQQSSDELQSENANLKNANTSLQEKNNNLIILNEKYKKQIAKSEIYAGEMQKLEEKIKKIPEEILMKNTDSPPKKIRNISDSPILNKSGK